MFDIEIHKNAQKALSKAPERIQQKVTIFVHHLTFHGTKNPPYRIKPMHGEFGGYHEVVIDKDYRIIFRKTNSTFLIRYAGTHNELGTG